MNLGILHEQYETFDGRLVLFKCKECDYITLSLGGLHAHIERHRGYTRFNIQIPFTKTSPGDVSSLMKRTEVLQVDETTEIELNAVKEL